MQKKTLLPNTETKLSQGNTEIMMDTVGKCLVETADYLMLHMWILLMYIFISSTEGWYKNNVFNCIYAFILCC